MGLAAYGQMDSSIANKLRRLIAVEGLRIVYPVRRSQFRKLVDEFFAQRRRGDQDPLQSANLARTGHQVFVDAVIELLRNVYEVAPYPDLVVGGGCFLNSVLNGLIVEHTPYDRVHAFSAPGDDGNALGAALLSAVKRGSKLEDLERPLRPYLGSEPSTSSLRRIVEGGGIQSTAMLVDIPRQISFLLERGLIVGWMRGRAEFGPRALGARSILADPRSVALAAKINSEVKFREAFRPLAPSILEGHESRYFSNPQGSPYMERALQFGPAGSTVPGVTHVDGTGRLHSVIREWNPVYYDTIDRFRQRCGIPMVINTSLNVMGKPIVHTVEDALAVFLGSGLDAIVIEDQVFAKSEATIELARRALIVD